MNKDVYTIHKESGRTFPYIVRKNGQYLEGDFLAQTLWGAKRLIKKDRKRTVKLVYQENV